MLKRTDILKIVISGSGFLIFVSMTMAQNVGNWRCEDEVVHPNLVLKVRKHVYGQLNDPSGATFKNSTIVLRRQNKNKFVEYRTTSTDTNGKFDLGVITPGAYRFLSDSNRLWKQPGEIKCSSASECEINLVLQANPTDQQFGQCAIQ